MLSGSIVVFKMCNDLNNSIIYNLQVEPFFCSPQPSCINNTYLLRDRPHFGPLTFKIFQPPLTRMQRKRKDFILRHYNAEST